MMETMFSLEDEYICGWLVKAEQKRIWKKELEMANVLIEICKKHDVRLCAGFGTVLGAVRHNGFIPWDNDMDFIIPREDYHKLVSLENEFKYPYFLQTVETEQGKWFRGWVRVVDCNTTCITPSEIEDNKTHSGIYIDVFPMDRVPNPKHRFECKCFEVGLNYRRFICTLKAYGKEHYQNSGFMKRNAAKLFSVMYRKRTTEELKNRFERYCEKYKDTSFDGYMAIGFGYGKSSRYKKYHKLNEFMPTVPHRFDTLEINIPENYDEYLKTLYGEKYMEYPPMEDRSFHYDNIMNPDIPYAEYIHMYLDKKGK